MVNIGPWLLQEVMSDKLITTFFLKGDLITRWLSLQLNIQKLNPLPEDLYFLTNTPNPLVRFRKTFRDMLHGEIHRTVAARVP